MGGIIVSKLLFLIKDYENRWIKKNMCMDKSFIINAAIFHNK